MKRILFGITLLLLSIGVQATANLTYSSNVQRAKHAIYRLNVEQFKHFLNKERQSNPDNLFIPYLEQCNASLGQIFGNAKDYGRYAAYLDASTKRIKQIKDNRLSSKYWYYLLGEMEFQTASVSAQFHSEMNAAKHVRLALIYLSKCRLKYPDFYGPVKSLSVIKEAIEALPSGYQRLVKVVGFDVKGEPGRAELLKLVNSNKELQADTSFYNEAQYFLAMMDYYLANDHQATWERIDALTKNPKGNLFLSCIRANFGVRLHKYYEINNCFWADIKKSGDFMRVPVMQYFYGLYKMSSEIYVEEDFMLYRKYGGTVFSENSRIYQYYCSYLSGKDNANEILDGVISLDKAKSEQDKHAARLAAKYRVNPPNKKLLKSQILYDAGKYRDALHALLDFKEKDFGKHAEKLEYNYRKARIYQALGKQELSRLFYLEVLKKRGSSTSYFPGYSALYIAEISEEQGKVDLAQQYYKMAITVAKGKEYEKTIELKAKAGLKRLRSL